MSNPIGFGPNSTDPNPCVQLWGVTEGQTCKTCRHLHCKQYGKRYYKCDLRQMTNGPATDHRISWTACGKWEGR